MAFDAVLELPGLERVAGLGAEPPEGEGEADESEGDPSEDSPSDGGPANGGSDLPPDES